MKKNVKAQRIDELKGLFDKNGTYYLFNYNKMTVAQATILRKNLRKQGSSLKIVKNRLALRSVPEPLAGDLKPVFRKPTAVAFTEGDAVLLAKTLKEFQIQNKVLVLKGGVVEGAFVGPERFDEIVKLPGRMDLMAKFGGLMASPLSGFLRCLRAPLGNVGILLNQLKTKKESA
jgi:large subunit ribosomal protein L10